MKCFRCVLVSAILILGLGAAIGSVTVPVAAQRQTPAPPTQQGRNVSPCESAINASLSADKVRDCDPVTATVHMQPSCPFCMGGLSLVFVRPEKALTKGQAWAYAAANGMLRELEQYQREYEKDHGQPFLVQVGVVMYDEERAYREVDITSDVDAARRGMRFQDGTTAGGPYIAAAQAAVDMLKRGERSKEAKGNPACLEVIVYFLDFTDVADVQTEIDNLRMARGIIMSRADKLFVGCVAESTLDGCMGTEYLPADLSYYFHILNNPSSFATLLMRDFRKIEDRQPPNLIRRMTLTQRLPAGLSYVAGSGVPEPAKVDVISQTTTLLWAWDPFKKIQPIDVRYVIQPVRLGTWNVEGGLALEDVNGQDRAVVMATQAISVSEPCVPPSPTPTDTPEPTPTPTDTPTATATTVPSATATPRPSATATPTVRPTRVPEAVYLPVTLREECVPGQRRIDVALVMDASMSMLEPVAGGGTKLDAARDAAGTFLDSVHLDQGDQAAIVSFNATATVLQTLSSDRAALDQAFGRMQTVPGTRIHLGIAAAHAELISARHQARNGPVMILLTDGYANPEPAEVAVVRAAAAKADGITIFTIGLGDQLDFDALVRMASKPEYFYHAPDAADLEAIYATIAVTLPCPPAMFWGGR